jgi:hypothetical protein
MCLPSLTAALPTMAAPPLAITIALTIATPPPSSDHAKDPTADMSTAVVASCGFFRYGCSEADHPLFRPEYTRYTELSLCPPTPETVLCLARLGGDVHQTSTGSDCVCLYDTGATAGAVPRCGHARVHFRVFAAEHLPCFASPLR